MLYVFKSAATGSLVMTEAVAHRLLAIVGKPASAPGILTVEQLPAARAALQAAVAQERAEAAAQAPPEHPAEPRPDSAEDPHEAPPAPVSLAQRAWPLLDMLQAAERAGKPVTWDV